MIPQGNRIRVLVPALLSLIFLFGPRTGGWDAKSRLIPWLLGFVAVGAVSSFFCVAPTLGLMKLALYMAVIVPALLCPSLFAWFAPLSRHLLLFTTACLVVLAASLAGVAVFRNPNTLGALALFSIPLMALQLGHGSIRRRRLATIAIMIGVVVCVASASRGATLGLLVGAAVFFGLKRSSSIRSIIFVGTAVAAVSVLLFSTSDRVAKYSYKGQNRVIDDIRMNMMDETLTAFRERPILGYGFGLSWRIRPENVEAALRHGRLSWYVGEFGNSTLALLAGGGLLLVIVVYGIVGTVVLTGIRSLRVNGRDWPYRQFQLAMTSGVLATLTQAQAEAWLMAPMNWQCVLFWLYCGSVFFVATHPAFRNGLRFSRG